MDSPNEGELGFVQRRLPTLIAAGALLIFLFTIERYPTFAGVAVLAKVTGWDWRPNVVAPLHWVLTFPVRWLPASAQLIGLNLTAAICAVLSLGLLARSVALLPHDRTRVQRRTVRNTGSLMDWSCAWLPPVVAAMICGFQLTFWENAVVGTGEALDLLLFAWLVNCLLEYRLDRQESRLNRFSMVYGVAVVNNFAMIGFFPAFLTALIWIKGRSFFNLRVLLRLAGYGCGGLSLYLVSPLVHYLDDPQSYGFWEMFRGNLSYQKTNLLAFPRYIVLLCAFTSLFPILFVAIRWPSRFGEASSLGIKLTNFGVHLIHVVFLIACVAVAFDPPFSPRHLSKGISAMLPFYYLGALSVGYCAGYALTICYAAGLRAERRDSRVGWLASLAVSLVICLLTLGAGAGLFVKNLSSVRETSGPAMLDLAHAAARSLPAQSSVVLSDDPFYLYCFKRELLKIDPADKHILIDTTSFNLPEYHHFLQRKHAGRWPGFINPPPKKVPIDPANLVNVILQVGESMPLFYLHPSFGYYFEFLYAKPHRMLYQLRPYPTNALLVPPLSVEEIRMQDDFWSSRPAATLLGPAPSAPVAEEARPRRVSLGSYVRNLSSRALNDFGATVQRAGDTERAAKYFDLALQVDEGNEVAVMNRAFNRHLRQEGSSPESARRFKPSDGRWDLWVARYGAFDEPTTCYRLAQLFAAGNYFRQAGQQLDRTIQYSPDNKSARLDYMMMCVRLRLADLAVNAISKYRAHFGGANLRVEEEMELLRIQAWAEVIKKNLPEAEKLLTDAQNRHPTQPLAWSAAVEIYLQLGQETNALQVLKRQLEHQPDNVRALVSYGGIKLKNGDFEGALPHLEHALKQQPNDEDGLYNHALACSATGRPEAAQKDFLTLLARGTNAYRRQTYFGLAESCFRMNKREESLRYYRDFLRIGGGGAKETELARERIKLLEARP